MRKQYHFRAVSEDIHIWDVDHLLALTQGLPIKQVTLSSIRELDEHYWYRDELPTTRQIAEHFNLVNAADLKYPIILCADGRVMDGMHRVVKAYLKGLTTINAVRFVQTPLPDFINVGEDDLQYDE